MRLRSDQLCAALADNRPLASSYLIFGDEPLLAQEAADRVRTAAKRAGYDERTVLDVETGFDWGRLTQTATSGSLFSQRRLIELRLGQSKPGDAGSKALQSYCTSPPADTVLLLSAARIDTPGQRSRWFTALERAGMVVQVWPLKGPELPAWIDARMRTKGLIPQAEAITLLAARVEGNLLAAAQEIDKLWLHYGAGHLTAEQLLSAVADSSRFDVFDLADAALQGKVRRCSRVLSGLQAEGVEPVLVLWSLTRDVRLLALLHRELAAGKPLAAALTAQKVWEKRKPLVSKAVRRLSAADCARLTVACAQLDQRLKGASGQRTLRPWDELLALCLRLAGQNRAS